MAGVDMDLVRQKQQEVDERSNFKDVPFLKFKDDGIYTLRILPPHGESRQFWLEFQKAFNVGPNRKHIVPLAQFAQECPLQKRIDELNKAGDELSKKEAAKMRPKSRVSMMVIDRKNEAAGPQIWETNLDVFRDVLTIMSDPDFGDITHPETGTDIAVSYVKEGRTGFSEWSPQPKRNASKLSDNEQQKKEWLETDWFTLGRVGKPSDVGYIQAVLDGNEVAYNEARKRQFAEQKQEQQAQAPQTQQMQQTAPPVSPVAPPPLAAPVAASVEPIVTHKFLAGTKLWQALNGQVGETTVEAVCQRLRSGENPDAVQVMAYDQAGGWMTATNMGFTKTVPALQAPPVLPPPPASPLQTLQTPPVLPPAMPATPPPPGVAGVLFNVPPSEAQSLAAQLSGFNQTPNAPISQVAQDIAAALGR